MINLKQHQELTQKLVEKIKVLEKLTHEQAEEIKLLEKAIEEHLKWKKDLYKIFEEEIGLIWKTFSKLNIDLNSKILKRKI